MEVNIKIKINSEAEGYINKVMRMKNISFNEAVEQIVNKQAMNEYHLVKSAQKAVENAVRKNRHKK